MRITLYDVLHIPNRRIYVFYQIHAFAFQRIEAIVIGQLPAIALQAVEDVQDIRRDQYLPKLFTPCVITETIIHLSATQLVPSISYGNLRKQRCLQPAPSYGRMISTRVSDSPFTRQIRNYGKLRDFGFWKAP